LKKSFSNFASAGRNVIGKLLKPDFTPASLEIFEPS